MNDSQFRDYQALREAREVLEAGNFRDDDGDESERGADDKTYSDAQDNEHDDWGDA